VGFYVVHQVSSGRPNLILQPLITTKNPNFKVIYFILTSVV